MHRPLQISTAQIGDEPFLLGSSADDQQPCVRCGLAQKVERRDERLESVPALERTDEPDDEAALRPRPRWSEARTKALRIDGIRKNADAAPRFGILVQVAGNAVRDRNQRM